MNVHDQILHDLSANYERAEANRLMWGQPEGPTRQQIIAEHNKPRIRRVMHVRLMAVEELRGNGTDNAPITSVVTLWNDQGGEYSKVAEIAHRTMTAVFGPPEQDDDDEDY